jgi:1-deoxy-D-xylulose-5-phosphate synthase
VAILGLGPMITLAQELAARLEREGYSAAVINPRFIKPIDREMLEPTPAAWPLLSPLKIT